MEYILRGNNNDEAWICLCGNDDFLHCDREGNERHPDKGWEGLYVCTGCGRIIQQSNRQVIGQNPHFKLAGE